MRFVHGKTNGNPEAVTPFPKLAFDVRTHLQEPERTLTFPKGDSPSDCLAGENRRNRLLLHGSPSGLGIELGHCGCRFCRGLPQILLEQHAILVDHEGHHA
jgi:hypothetical protein